MDRAWGGHKKPEAITLPNGLSLRLASMNWSRTRSELQLTIAHTPPPFHLAQLLSALCSLLRCRFQLLSLDTSIELDMGWILLPTEQLQLVSWIRGNLAQPPSCDSGSRRVSVSRVSQCQLLSQVVSHL